MTDFTTEPVSAENTQSATVRWEEGRAWRLIQIGEGQQALFPPGRSKLVKPREDILPGRTMGRSHPIVVLGEGGSGRSSFVNWACKIHETEDPLVPLIRLNLAPVGFHKAHEAEQAEALTREFWRAAETAKMTLPRRGERSERRGGTGAHPEFRTDDSLADAICECAKEHSKPFSVLCEGLHALREDVQGLLWSTLRGVIEQRRIEHVRLVLIGRSEDDFHPPGAFSEFLGVCRVYRTAHFLPDEINELWHRHAASDNAELGKEVFQWTGGQPLLVQLFLGRLAKVGEGLEATGRWLMDHPPPCVRSWQEGLATLVLDDQQVKRKMDSYVREQTDSELGIGPELRRPFLAGWVGEEPQSKRWGIRSRVHAEWAKDPLRNPEKFKPSRGARGNR